MTDSSTMSEDTFEPTPRLYMSFPITTDFSYADLLETYASHSGIQLITNEQSISSQHRYPVVIQSLITRLENCGKLANTHDIARHTSKDRQTDEPCSDQYYDLDDEFMDDTGEMDSDKENEFDDAVKLGHYVLRPEEFQWSITQSKSEGKKKAKDFSMFPEIIRKRLEELSSLYNSKQSQKGKRALILITGILGVASRQTSMPDTVDLFLTISEISGYPLTRIEHLASKLKSASKHQSAVTTHQRNAKTLKNIIIVECRSVMLRLSKKIQKGFESCLDSLKEVAKCTEELNALRTKPVPGVDLEMEEKKLEKEVETWSGGRLIVTNREVSLVSQDLPTLPSSNLLALLSLPPNPIINLEAPPTGHTYDSPPQYTPEHFKTVIDLLDS